MGSTFCGKERKSPQKLATINDKHTARHVAAGLAGEVEGQRADLFGTAPTAHGDAGGDLAFKLGLLLDPAFVGVGQKGARREKLADKIKLTYPARVETKKVGNHEMSDRQTNAMQDADFIPWKKGCCFDR